MKSFAGILCCTLVGCSGTTSNTAQVPATLVAPAEPEVYIGSFDLHEAYATNEAAAKLKYGDKWLMTVGIKGQLAAIGNRYELNVINAGEVLILCRFDKSQEAALAAMPIGKFLGFEKVAVIGRVAEIKRGSSRSFRNTLVVLDHCEVRPMPPQWMPQKEKN